MTGLDLLLIVLFVVAIVTESVRGFGVAFLDCLALYCASLLTGILLPTVSQILFHESSSGSNQTLCFLGTFAVISVILLFVSWLVHKSLLIDIGMFDKLGGLVGGAVAAVIVCHALVSGLAVGNAQESAAVSGSFSQELLTFSSYHAVINGINSAMGAPPNSS